MPTDRKTAEALLDEYDDAQTYGPTIEAVDKARAAVLDAMTTPEGWVLVPKVPTPEMKAKFYGSTGTWADVLAAGPQPKDPT